MIESEKDAAMGAPRYAHNRYPRDVVDLSEGQTVAEFAREWVGRVAEAAVGDDGAEDEGEDVERGRREEERIGR